MTCITGIGTMCLVFVIASCNLTGDNSDNNRDNGAPHPGMTVNLTALPRPGAVPTIELVCEYTIDHYPPQLLPVDGRVAIWGKIEIPGDVFALSAGDTAWTDTLRVGSSGHRSVVIVKTGPGKGQVDAYAWAPIPQDGQIGGYDYVWVGD